MFQSRHTLVLLLVTILAFSISLTAQPEFRINAGGSSHVAENGDTFDADQAYTPGGFGFVGGSVYTFSFPISGTNDDILYNTLRFGLSPFSYQFDNLPVDDYQVTLHFTEPQNTQSSGTRLIDISAEGQLVIDNLDVFTESGGLFNAHTETIIVNVTDGQLNIDLSPVTANEAYLYAIEVVGTTPPQLDPDISITPLSVDFGQVEEATTADATVNISNTGDATLTVTALSIDTGEFAVIGQSVPFDVAPGADLDITVRFSPSSPGVQNGTLTIDSNDPDEASVGVSMTGEGTAAPPMDPDIAVTPLSLDFGSVENGSSADLTINISNTGNATLTVTNLTSTNGTFAIVGQSVPFNITAGANLDIIVRFSPTVDGVQNGDLDIDSNDPDEATVTVSLTGEGTAAPPMDPDIAVTPLSLDFGSVENGSSADLTVNISNTGNATLTVTGLTSTNSTFAIVGQSVPFNITAGANLDIIVRFSPTADGVQNGDLDIDSNDPDEATVTVSLTGTGSSTPPPAPDIAVNPDYNDYGQVEIGTSADRTINISNSGNATLTVTGLSTTNSDFAVIGQSAPFDIAAGGDLDITVRFTPSTPVIINGNLEVVSNDPDEGLVTSWLTGEGVPGAPTPVAFRINAGGSDYTTVGGDAYVADRAYSAGDYGYVGGSPYVFSFPISGTSDDVMYNTLRFGVTPFEYRFDNLEAGDYDVTMHFTEPQSGQTVGSRLIDITAEGQLMVDDLDIFGESGGLFFAHTRSFTANVADGQLNLVITPQTPNEATVYAIEVVSSGGVGAPDIDVSPLSFDFEDMPVNSTFKRTISISNVGSDNLTVTGFTSTNPAFSVVGTATPVTVGAGAILNISVAFSPTSTGIISGDLQISSDDPDESVVTVALTGEGTEDPNAKFADVAASSGLVLEHDLAPICNPPLGSGSAWADIDNDGDVDLYVTNHGGANHMYRNDGDTDSDGLPNFTDIAVALGVDEPGQVGLACVFIDYDNDGDQDLYACSWGGNTLYENQLVETGSLSFSDVTTTSGLRDFGRAMTTAWGDYDNDGFLDVYITKHRYCSSDIQSQDNLYHNNGDGTFTEVTTYLCPGGGTSCSQIVGLGFSPGWVDYDNDGDLDLYLVNDDIDQQNTPNVLWRNDGSDGVGGWLFTDVSEPAGANQSLNGMGLGIGDYDNDGDLDMAFSNAGPNVLLRNNGDATFTDVAPTAGVDRGTIPATGEVSITWGTVFFDYNNDRWLDLYIAAGNVYVTGNRFEPNALFENNQNGTFSDISLGSGVNHPGNHKNASTVDLDNDGFVDFFSGGYGEAPQLYHNREKLLGNTSHYLTVTVEGTDSNRDGIGTRLYLTTGDNLQQMREINSGPTHGGGDYRAAYFGLGTFTSATLEIHWPNGEIQNLGSIAADQKLHYIEPQVLEGDISVATSSFDFQDMPINSTFKRTIKISNTGPGKLTISSFNFTNAAFSTVGVSTPAMITSGETLDLSVAFSPTATGSVSGDLQINSDDPDESLVVVSLSGEGTDDPNAKFKDVAASSGLVLAHDLASICTPPLGSGSAWADVDNDGDVDLYVTNHGGANHLYLNEGDTDSDGLPNFTDMAAAMGIDEAGLVGLGCVFIDYDNDGDQDLYTCSWGGNALYENQTIENGSLSFIDVTATAGLADFGRGMTTAWGDYDNDGFLDVYVTKHRYCTTDIQSQDNLYHNNGDGTFTEVTGYLCPGGTAPCFQVIGLGFSPGWVDYDNDGDLDLYLVNDDVDAANTPNVLWRNDGPDGSGGWLFSDVSAAAGANQSLNGMGLGIGDYDNDGDLDMAFSNAGANVLLRNNGNATFTDVAGSAGIQRASIPGTGEVSITWGTVFFDYNNDRWEDLYLAAGNVWVDDNRFEPNAFFENDQSGGFTDISIGSGVNHPGNHKNASKIDLDNDGFVDFFSGGYGEAPQLYHNREKLLGNSSHYLTVTVEGTESNRDGIGTRLYLTTSDNLQQMREINSGPTHGGGDYRAAYFGLGTFTSGTLEIHWPNGETENFGSIAADQQLHYIEPPSGVTKSGDDEANALPTRFALHQNYPNPFNPSTTVAFDLPKQANVKLKIYNLLGEEVRDLANEIFPAGTHQLTWDGKDNSGNALASGIYLYRFNARGFTQTRKMFLIK